MTGPRTAGFTAAATAVTPAEQAVLLKQAAAAPVDVRVVPGADHFSFMDTRPPGTADPAGFDRETHVRDLRQATLEFILHC